MSSENKKKFLDDKAEKLTNAADRKLNRSTQRWMKAALICVTLLGVCLIAGIAGYLLQVLATPVSIVIWSTVIVFLLRGIVAFLERKGVNRVLGTTIAYVVLALVIGVVLFFVFSPAFGFTKEFGDIMEKLPTYFERFSNWFNELKNTYGNILQNEMVQDWLNDTMSNLGNIGGDVAAASAGGILAAGGAVGSFFMAFGFALVIGFWILIELPKLGREFNRFVKPKYKKDVKMWHYIFTHVMSGYIKGTFLQCFIIGLAAGILFAILGIENAAALGTLTGLLNIIPIVGPWIGGLVACVGGVFNNIWIGLIALAGTIAIQQFVYTFISPKIMSSSVDIHPALSLFALTAGGAIGGAMSGLTGSLVGMLLSIPAVAVFKSLFVYYYEKNTGRRIIAKDGVFFKGIALGDDTAKPMVDAISPSPDVLSKKATEKEKRAFAEEFGIKPSDIDLHVQDKELAKKLHVKIEDLEEKVEDIQEHPKNFDKLDEETKEDIQRVSKEHEKLKKK